MMMTGIFMIQIYLMILNFNYLFLNLKQFLLLLLMTFLITLSNNEHTVIDKKTLRTLFGQMVSI